MWLFKVFWNWSKIVNFFITYKIADKEGHGEIIDKKKDASPPPPAEKPIETKKVE
jgi:hypothetical protein